MKKMTGKVKQVANPFVRTKSTSPQASSYQKETVPSARIVSQDLQKRIQEKAYEIFERRGYSHGNDWADWFEAERIVRSQDN